MLPLFLSVDTGRYGSLYRLPEFTHGFRCCYLSINAANQLGLNDTFPVIGKAFVCWTWTQKFDVSLGVLS
jgi:hypothetical protein